ncbi:MAG: TetR/AcrR family transcriptional regulator [Desulfobacterales bacterium]|nr:TetR/AcrR family transcriptional regulator [Desulfobacterales bacterium]MCP4163788.1 TetR/AcrR family transcriptional regulator [Deltaproteobacteria bacterium]
MEDICYEIIQDDNNSIKVKNERVGVKKLKTIIETAITISNRKGFHAMSLRELCSECGLSMGGLYGYISSKDELLEVIQDQGRRLLLKVMDTYGNEKESSIDQLTRAIYTHIYLSELMQPWFFFSYMEARFFIREEQEKSIETELLTEQIFSEILEMGRLKGDFKLGDPVLTASAIKSMLQDWYLKRWKYNRRNISVDDYAKHVISFVMAFVKGDC